MKISTGNYKNKFSEEAQAQIDAEFKMLRRQFSNIGPKRKKIVDGLMWRAAFMRVQLQEIELDISQNGRVEEFSQSSNTDPYDRERPVVRIYNTMIKNYLAVIKELSANLAEAPAVEQTPQDKEAAEFQRFKDSRDD